MNFINKITNIKKSVIIKFNRTTENIINNIEGVWKKAKRIVVNFLMLVNAGYSIM